MTGNPPEMFLPTYLGGPQITTENCEREPIHIPGSIQPHGALLTVDAQTHQILQVSLNSEAYLGRLPSEVRGAPLSSLLPVPILHALVMALPTGAPDHLQYRTTFGLPTGHIALTAHRVEDLLVLEFEMGEATDATGSQALRNAVFALESAPTLMDLTQVAARLVQEISGFDRVMIYRFAEDASGEVIAEAHGDDMTPFLKHRFPAADIPVQARTLYVRHLLRLTADTHAAPIPLDPVLNPQTGQPTPLGGAVLRSTSPMHLQYLRNMGVRSSLSVSIVVDGQLWGLIACHHGSAYVVSPETRTALEYLGRLLSLQVQVKDRADIDAFRRGLQNRHRQIVDAVAHSLAPLDTLTDEALDLRGLMQATGVIVFFEGRWQVRGTALTPGEVEALLSWLRTREGTFFQTEALSEHWPPALALRDRASGLLAISVGSGWSEGVVWLRPEIRAEVAWGGATPEQAKDTLGPRRSFETYVETVRGHAAPWHAGEVEEAQDLQRALTAALGERLSVVRSLNAALEQSNAEWRQYAFVIAHDMQEPVRLIAQFAELFQLRYQDRVDANGERMIQFILAETARLRSLTRDLHTYTDLLSAPPPTRRSVPLGQILEEVLETLEPQLKATGVQVRVQEDLPTVQADPARLRDLLRHLLGNALTFGGPTPEVQVGAERVSGAWNITVQDQGVGIAPEFHDKVFGLFQRLNRQEDMPGNGIGLTLCRKIAETHGGSLRLVSAPGQGTSLTFHLPDPRKAAHNA